MILFFTHAGAVVIGMALVVYSGKLIDLYRRYR